jgi:hypothetical protein
VQTHDPRREFERRRTARARVHLVRGPASTANEDGSVASRQEADVTLPRTELDRMWSAEYLERLARTYWRFLTRVSLGVLRVLYTPTSREVVFLRRPFRLLTFHAPEYTAEPDCGEVTWRINRGLLVAPNGRNKGYLRISVRRPPESLLPDDPTTTSDDFATIRVKSEVENFYPLLRGWGWFARIGRHIYSLTQVRIHKIVTNAFLRSLARLDLAPSIVGQLRTTEDQPLDQEPAEEDRQRAQTR